MMDNDGYTFVVDMLLGNAVHAVLEIGRGHQRHCRLDSKRRTIEQR